MSRIYQSATAFAAEISDQQRRNIGKGYNESERNAITTGYASGYRAALIDIEEATHNLANIRQVQELIKELRK